MQRNVGIKKFSDVVIINPVSAYKRVIAILGGVIHGTLTADDKLILLDGSLLATLGGMLLFASSNGIGVVKNVRD